MTEPAEPTITELLQFGATAEEHQILREILKSLKGIRFGSIVLTIHEGQIVELSKTVRLRTRPPSRG
jgi:hypothetical protein